MAAAAGGRTQGGTWAGPNSDPFLNSRRRARHQGPGEAVRGVQVTLEKVLGITTQTSSSLACDPVSGLLAYPAGCVVVILNPRENTQRHILNTSRKTLSALAFSPNGKLIVTGENGHQPAVRVWDVEEQAQVSVLHGHKHGVACVAFSPSAKYLVSVGYPHDMGVNVWDWEKHSLVASNKVSCKVTAISFSENSYFVTVGQRHVKFWFLDSSRELKINKTVPLVGRLGLLGELHNNVFCGVACGRGQMLGSTFCISSSGLLCQLNEKRVLEKWMFLKVPLANCLCVGEELIFCGCANGTVRIFRACDMGYLSDLPRPHPLGVDVTQDLPLRQSDVVYPDTIALAYDTCNHWVSCVYKDHSVYVWDVGDLQNIRKVWSGLFHSSFIWTVEVYPEIEEQRSCLPPGSFLTCSSDNTIRTWTLESGSVHPIQGSTCSTTLLNIIYVDNNTQHLQESCSTSDQSKNVGQHDAKSRVRVMQVSPNGEHLALGDSGGTLRIYELRFMQQVAEVEAHNSEVLCLEYSKPETGAALLASAGRDTLIHILNVDKNYKLEQTLHDHSSAITSIKFAGNGDVQLISCGADKNIFFRSAQKLPGGFHFLKMHHIAEKTTLYDMDIDITQKYIAVACQDRNIRVYSTASGKLKYCYKGSQDEDGSFLKVQLDPSGTFLATSCSNKSITLINFHSGECVAKMFGHSEIVTGMRFTYDCRHLITVSGDSCIFIWHLDLEITSSMKQHLLEFNLLQLKEHSPWEQFRWETQIPISGGMLVTGASGASDEEPKEKQDKASTPQIPSKEHLELSPVCILINGRLPMWAKRLLGEVVDEDEAAARQQRCYQPQGRWSERAERVTIKTLTDTYVIGFTPVKLHLKDDEELSPGSLEQLASEVSCGARSCTLHQALPDSGFNCSWRSPACQCLSLGKIWLWTSATCLQQEESSPSDLTKDSQLRKLFSDEETNRRLESSDTTRTSLQELHMPEASRQHGMELPLCPTYAEEPRVSWKDTSSCASLHEGMPVPCCQPEDDLVGSDREVEKLEENLPQSNSLPQTPRREKYLKQHFETLADTEAAEKFDRSLKDFKSPKPEDEEKKLNPHLNISSRFFQCQKSRPAAAFPLQKWPWLQSPAGTQGLQQSEKSLDEKALATGQETGSNVRKPTGVCLKRGFLHPKPTPRMGTRWVFVAPSRSRGGDTRLTAAVLPTGPHLCIETFIVALRLLHTCFQETLGLYNQLTLCAETTTEDVLHARAALASLFGWVKAELRSHAVIHHTDTAVATNSPPPAPPPDPETSALLRAYSNSHEEMVQNKQAGEQQP